MTDDLAQVWREAFVPAGQHRDLRNEAHELRRRLRLAEQRAERFRAAVVEILDRAHRGDIDGAVVVAAQARGNVYVPGRPPYGPLRPPVKVQR